MENQCKIGCSKWQLSSTNWGGKQEFDWKHSAWIFIVSILCSLEFIREAAQMGNS